MQCGFANGQNLSYGKEIMRLSKDLCFGNRAQKYIPYLMENLREGHIVPMAYLVYSGYGSNLFEFYSSSMLKMKNFPRKEDDSRDSLRI